MELGLLMYTSETSVASRSSRNPWLGILQFTIRLELASCHGDQLEEGAYSKARHLLRGRRTIGDHSVSGTQQGSYGHPFQLTQQLLPTTTL